MRTTINLPDSLLKQAKRAALDADTTLSDFIADAVRLMISEKQRRRAKPSTPLPTFRPTPGLEGFQPGVDLDHMADTLDMLDELDAANRR
jgi:hypothetical protein